MILKRLWKTFVVPAFAVGVTMLSITTAARADLEIWAREDSGHWTLEAITPSGGPAITAGFTIDSYTVSVISADSNSPGNSTKSFAESSNLHVTGGVGSSSHTLQIILADTGFSAPVTPPPLVMSSHIGGSVSTGGPDNSLSFQSYVDSDNIWSLNGISQPGPLVGATTASLSPSLGEVASTGPQTPDITSATLSYSNDASTTITSLTSSYSLVQGFSIVLDAGGQFGWQANTQLTTTPEPATLASAMMGLSLFGLVALRRRSRRA